MLVTSDMTPVLTRADQSSHGQSPVSDWPRAGQVTEYCSLIGQSPVPWVTPTNDSRVRMRGGETLSDNDITGDVNTIMTSDNHLHYLAPMLSSLYLSMTYSDGLPSAINSNDCLIAYLG